MAVGRLCFGERGGFVSPDTLPGCLDVPDFLAAGTFGSLGRAAELFVRLRCFPPGADLEAIESEGFAGETFPGFLFLGATSGWVCLAVEEVTRVWGVRTLGRGARLGEVAFLISFFAFRGLL